MTLEEFFGVRTVPTTPRAREPTDTTVATHQQGKVVDS